MFITKEDLKKTGLSPNELYILYSITHNDIAHLENFFSKEFIYDTVEILVKNKYLRTSGLNKVTLKKKTVDLFKRNSQEEFLYRYRKLFQDTKKLGAMGDKQSCVKKMTEFRTENPSYTSDIIIKAVKLYIKQERDNNNFKFLQSADNFIYKDGRSRLSIFCEEILNGKEDKNSDEGHIIKA